jgi:hypothetical protein
MKPKSRLAFYLFINILVSAATTLAVLWIWDSVRSNNNGTKTNLPVTLFSFPTPLPTLPPTSTPVIEINAVIGAGDPQAEFVEIKRLGENELALTGWSLRSEGSNVYKFPEGMVLNKGAVLQIYTQKGVDSALKLYWGLDQAAWRQGGKVLLVDREGGIRATFQVP